MAGSYPDAPSRRMAWDDDGSVALARWSDDSLVWGALRNVPATEMEELNDEDSVTVDVTAGATLGNGSYLHTAIIFPELREFDGIFARAAFLNKVFKIESSQDTTNGVDGTWDEQTADYSDPDSDVYSNYRTVLSIAASDVRGVRVEIRMTGTSGSRPRAIHIYGTIAPGETPDRLLWVDEDTGLEFNLPLDWGDVPRGSARDHELRLRNNSAGLTATTVQITTESLYLASSAWYTLDVGAGYASTRLIASIGPASDSALITIRQVVPDTEVLGLHAARLYANTASWA